MSTRTSSLVLFSALGLTACDAGGIVSRAPTRIVLPDGIVVAGADGWCVDTRSTGASSVTSVVVLGSCAAIGGKAEAASPDVPGVVTVSVTSGGGDAPSPEELEAYFVTERGRAALARDGQPGSVRIVETRRTGSLLFLHARDMSALPGASDDVWKALFDLDGRVVSISLFGLEDRPIARDEGLSTLAAQVDELKAANDG
ncbi:hypothetical protein EF888_17400 [Silicimonas algicola]|uniref:Lipoprotein n=1 Tax=Silicimonas algicola TaxID=1826607 RepID=A0A316GMP7_9RHOB|nr:hypothetical protein [Silicimonas algicola]AZQ68745.1 hypothetical protein EF888_17400 [Silicimonas algicola]PWK56177.1 hypothetical protein C8D95_105244 [Silicimonas algicola]